MTEVVNNNENGLWADAGEGALGGHDESGGWMRDLPDELRKVALAKGWQEPADALKSYKHLEEYLGADKSGRGLVLPKNEDDREGYLRLYQALGRPESPEGYGLAEVLSDHDDLDPAFMENMTATMHEAGLNKRQAHQLALAWQKQVEEYAEQDDRRYKNERDEVLRGESPARLEAARRGFRLCGALPEQAEVLERALGPRAAVDIFSRIGEIMAEDSQIKGGRGQGSAASPDAARARIDRLMADPAFSRRYLAGDKNALDEITELARRATLKY